MSETLKGVIIGSIIGIIGGLIVTIINIIYSYRIWEKDKLFQYLNSENSKFKSIYEDSLKKIASIIESKEFSIDSIANLEIMLPDKIMNEFTEHWPELENIEKLSKDEQDIKKQSFMIEIARIFKEDLFKREQEIRELLEKNIINKFINDIFKNLKKHNK
jgi:hypothetical protein